MGDITVSGVWQWSQIAPGYNWRTFHLIQIEVEDDRMLGAVELTFILLGLGFRIRWTHTRTEMVERLMRDLEDAKSMFEEARHDR